MKIESAAAMSVTRGGSKCPAVSVVLAGVLSQPSPRDDLCDRFSGAKSRWKPVLQAGTDPIAGHFEPAGGNEIVHEPAHFHQPGGEKII